MLTIIVHLSERCKWINGSQRLQHLREYNVN